MSQSDDEHQERIEQIAARKRFNMKSLGRQVDANRLTGVSRPPVDESNLPHRSTRGQEVVDDDPEETVVDEVEAEDETLEQDDTASDDGETGNDDDVAEDEADESASSDDTMPAADEAEASDPDDELNDTTSDDADDDNEQASDEVPAFDEQPDEQTVDGTTAESPARRRNDGVDRGGMGTSVTKSGLSSRLGDRVYEPIRSGDGTLARRMLDHEIQPGGRISDPRAVPGILLELAKDLPASVAVSVVRTDEEIELVGNTVDPNFEFEAFSSTFSGLFKSLQSASGAFRDGPFGKVRDVVIESDTMDLVLCPLGEDYYLMVLEDRTSPEADLDATRRRMMMLAPGLTAILAIADGDA